MTVETEPIVRRVIPIIDPVDLGGTVELEARSIHVSTQIEGNSNFVKTDKSDDPSPEELSNCSSKEHEILLRDSIATLQSPDREDPEVIEAFSCVMSHYQGPLVRFVRRITGSDEDAQEIVQEVFIKVWQYPTENPATFNAWIYKIALNRAINLKRSSHYQRSSTKDPGDFDSYIDGNGAFCSVTVSDPVAMTENMEKLVFLKGCMKDMAAAQQQAFISREVDGLSYAEICKEMDLSLAALKRLLQRARENLNIKMTEKFGRW